MRENMKKLRKTEVVVGGRVWTKELLKELFLKNDEAIVRAMLRIYDKQTEDEKISEYTRDDNGVGFSGVHGEIMTKFSKFYQERKYLSFKQMVVIKKIMPKYAGQLLKLMANENPSANQHFFKVRG